MVSKISEYPNSYLEVSLEEGEKFIVERGGMIFADGDYELKTKIEAKKVTNWIAKVIGGKSLSYNVYTAKKHLHILFSPDKNAELFKIQLQSQDAILIEANSHFARSPGIKLELAKQKLKTTLNDGIKLRANGEGHLFLTGYGKIIQKDIDQEEPILIDEDALIAYDEKLNVKTISKGIKQLLTSGEGYLFQISGKGRIWLQTREQQEMSGGGFIDSILGFFK